MFYENEFSPVLTSSLEIASVQMRHYSIWEVIFFACAESFCMVVGSSVCPQHGAKQSENTHVLSATTYDREDSSNS